jgi:hypothetical protein
MVVIIAYRPRSIYIYMIPNFTQKKAKGGAQGAGKKTKSATPVVSGWVRVRKRTRVRFIFSIFFYRVFELPSSRNAQKRD